MISQELIEWFQEEIKKNIADVVKEAYQPAFAVSLLDDNGLVWVEGITRARVEPRPESANYLLQYSIQRDEDLPEDCPYSISITVIDER